MEQLNEAITRIASADGQVFGAGFLIGDKRILTCAHVVSAALGLSEAERSQPADPVYLDFPFLGKGHWRTARVDFWRPVGVKVEDAQERAEDICVLELDEDPPAGSESALMLPASEVWDHSFRVLGFPAGRDNGVFATGKLRDQTAEGWLQGEATESFGFSVTQGFSGAPVWDADLPGVIGMVVAFETGANYRVAYILPASQILAAFPDMQSGLVPAEPYKGLAPFDESDANIFFGREQAARDLQDAVRDKPLVVLAGASGAGKSSLVFAGLVPALAREGDWLTLRMHPGKTPMKALAGAFAEELLRDVSFGELSTSTESFLRDLEEEGTLRRAAELVSQQPPRRGKVLLIVDQFEELYTECHDLEERDRFILLLVKTAETSTHTRPQVRIVLTMRADFLNAAAQNAGVTKFLNQSTLFLGPMSRVELRTAIERPAALKGARLEDDLTDLILDDVGGNQASLPLLEYALDLLWVSREKGKLTIDAYQRIGGVRSALAQRAQAVYEALDDVDKQRAERIFLQLVLPGDQTPDTRRTATREEVGEENWSVVSRLADERLLICDQDTVMLVHETLIERWAQLGDWIKANREFRTWQEELRTEMHLWDRNSQDEGWLLRGTPLNSALAFLDTRKTDLAESERAFIERSAEADTEARRKSDDSRLEFQTTIDRIRQQVLADDVDPPLFLGWRRAFAVWAIVSALVLLASMMLPFMRSAEASVYDLLFQLRIGQPARQDIVIVQTDPGFNLASSPHEMARTIDFFRRVGAKAVGLDLPYTDADSGAKYGELAAAIQSAQNVVVAGQLTNNIPDNQLSGITWAVHPPDTFVYHEQCGLIVPQWAIGGALRGLNLMQAGPEVETVCGKPGLQLGREYPALPVALVAVAQRDPISQRPKAVSQVVAGLDRHDMLVNYVGPAGGNQKPFVVRQFSSVTGDDPSSFKGAIVLITPAEDGRNVVQTPFGDMFEPYVEANALNTILDANPIVRASDGVNAIIVLVLTLTVAFLAARLSIGQGAAAGAVLVLAWPPAALAAFSIFRIWPAVVAPEVAALVVLSACLVLRFAEEERQGRRKRYIMHVFSALGLGREPEESEGGPEGAVTGTSRTVTLLSVRVPGFTVRSKMLPAQQVMACLDIFQGALAESVRKHHGTIHAYDGDGLTAAWNAPHYQRDHAMLAVLTGLDMIALEDDVNRQLQEAGLSPVQYGVGIATDRAVIAQLHTAPGDYQRIVGDVVSIVAQLSRAAHAGNILISESTWQIVGDRIVAPEVEPLIARESGQIFRTFQVINISGALPTGQEPALADTLLIGRTQ